MNTLRIFLLLTAIIFSGHAFSQKPENWTREQLMEPAQLAAQLKAVDKQPAIFSVGPGAVIASSVDIGSVSNKDNLDKFRQQLKSLPKNAAIVVYCGCCPFEHCPNVRPAIDALRDMKFTNYKLLNLAHNAKTDWLDKGYPSNKL